MMTKTSKSARKDSVEVGSFGDLRARKYKMVIKGIGFHPAEPGG